MVAMTVFTAFTVFAGLKILNGESTCGCFGDFSVSPTITIVFDCVALICLTFWRQSESHPSSDRDRGTLIFIFLWSAFAIVGFVRFSYSDNLAIARNGDWLTLKVTEWYGKPFPLFNYLNDDNQFLNQGTWRIILYHENCPSCQALMRDSTFGSEMTLLVEVPPYDSELQSDTDNIRWRRLTDKYRWFIRTPIEFWLKDGIVE